MTYEFYKILHLSSVAGVFMILSALTAEYSYSEAPNHKKIFGLIHGLGLLIILISGFGLLAKLGLVGGLPTWIYVKLAIWLALGASLTLLRKIRTKPLALIAGLWGLFVAAVITAVTKY